jgi:hypothetical protein
LINNSFFPPRFLYVHVFKLFGYEVTQSATEKKLENHRDLTPITLWFSF